MGHTSPNPPQSLDKILNVTTEQVWEAIRQLLELRPFVFNNDEGARISLAADKRDVARFEEHAVVQFQRPIQEVVQEMRDIFSYIVRPNHSRFMSVIPSPSSPISCLGEILTSAFNSWPAAWFAVATIETKLIAWLSTQIGMPTSTGGTFVSGGLLANLSALAIARDQKLVENTRSLGVPNEAIAGGFEFPPRYGTAPEKIIADKSKGLIPFLIVANAGSTNTGSIDPLNEIADLAKEHNM